MKPSGVGGGEVNMKFKVVKVVGKGSYGTVYKVQRLSDGQAYALKEMDVRSMNQAEREDAINEIRLLASVQHPNVISYNEAFLDGNKLCIIMDFAPDGDLARVIKKFQSERRSMPEDLVWKYFIQICNGLLALHRMKILHRDIKPGNIMIMPNDIAKIGDLGIAKVLSKTAAAKTQIGTPHYMPPEIWKNQPYGFSSDSWAMGCLLYEMMTLKVPFEARNIQELRNKVLRGVYPPVPVGGSQGYSRELAAVVSACLDLRPEKRPGMEDILNSGSVKARMHLVDGKMRNAPPPSSGSAMLDTIKVPRNIQMIKGKLPPAQYKSEMMDVAEEDEAPPPRPPPVPQPRSAPRLPDVPGAARGPGGGLLPRVAQPPLPPALHAAPGGQRIDPVLAQMQQKAAMIDNIYSVYNNPAKRPPPVQVAAPGGGGGDPNLAMGGGYGGGAGGGYGAGAGRPWYAQPKAAPNHAAIISESRAAYGAFYHSPGSAAAAAAAARGGGWEGQGGAYDNVLGGAGAAAARYKGHYVPGGGAGPTPADPSPYGARGGNWPAAGKLQPMPQRAAAGGGPPPRNARGGAPPQSAKPPPWNYGVAAAKTPAPSRGGQPPWRAGGGGFGADAGLQGHPVARYPPMQWSPPRLH